LHAPQFERLSKDEDEDTYVIHPLPLVGPEWGGDQINISYMVCPIHLSQLRILWGMKWSPSPRNGTSRVSAGPVFSQATAAAETSAANRTVPE